MSLGRAIDDAIGRAAEPGVIEAEVDGRRAEVEVIDTDRLGVRVRRVRVTAPEACDPLEVARELPERVRSLPERVEPVEVDPRLGGAIFRTVPGEVRDREFFEIDVQGRDTDVKRWKVDEGGREPADWTMTRRGLERLIDELG